MNQPDIIPCNWEPPPTSPPPQPRLPSCPACVCQTWWGVAPRPCFRCVSWHGRWQRFSPWPNLSQVPLSLLLTWPWALSLICLVQFYFARLLLSQLFKNLPHLVSDHADLPTASILLSWSYNNPLSLLIICHPLTPPWSLAINLHLSLLYVKLHLSPLLQNPYWSSTFWIVFVTIRVWIINLLFINTRIY